MRNPHRNVRLVPPPRTAKDGEKQKGERHRGQVWAYGEPTPELERSSKENEEGPDRRQHKAIAAADRIDDDEERAKQNGAGQFQPQYRVWYPRERYEQEVETIPDVGAVLAQNGERRPGEGRVERPVGGIDLGTPEMEEAIGVRNADGNQMVQEPDGESHDGNEHVFPGQSKPGRSGGQRCARRPLAGNALHRNASARGQN